MEQMDEDPDLRGLRDLLQVPQGKTPPCLFHLLPTIFCTDLCTAAEFKREETDLSHLILHSQRAGCSPGRWDMLIPSSSGPEPSTSQESALCTRQHICSQNRAVRVSHTGSAAYCGQCANPFLVPPSPDVASTESGVTLSRKSDKDQRQGLTDSAQTWEHLFRHGMLKSQLQ